MNSTNLCVCVWTRSTKPCPPESGQKSSRAVREAKNDCNMTAGLEAKLVFAIVAHVMLCRNIDTSIVLVNGVIGTVLCISKK